MAEQELQREEFVQLLVKTQRRIFALIHAMVPNTSDAEEVLQETSLILWRKWDSFDRSRDFANWALGIARFEVLKHLSKRKRAGALGFHEDLAEQIASLLVERASQPEGEHARRLALKKCLDMLCESDRELIDLRYRGNMTARGVAERLNRPKSTVYQALARIRRRLFECIQRRVAAEERSR